MTKQAITFATGPAVITISRRDARAAPVRAADRGSGRAARGCVAPAAARPVGQRRGRPRSRRPGSRPAPRGRRRSGPASRCAADIVELGRERVAASSSSSRARARARPRRRTGRPPRAAACPGSSRSRRAGSRRCRTRCRRQRALDDRGREAEVEAQRAHPGRLGRGEVAELVDGDRAAAGRRWRWRSSCGRRTCVGCGRARAAVGVEHLLERLERLGGDLRRARRSTTSAMSRKPIAPSRNAATATSLAAFRTHGAVPPVAPGLAGEREAAERGQVGRLELEAERRGQVERRRPAVGRALRDRSAPTRSARACRG